MTLPPSPFNNVPEVMAYAGGGIPTISHRAVLAAAIFGSVDDRVTEHAEAAVDVLSEAATDAVLLAICDVAQYIVSTGVYGSGSQAARRMRDLLRPQQEVPARPEAFLCAHEATARFVDDGRDGCMDYIQTCRPAPLAVLAHLLTVAIVTAGWAQAPLLVGPVLDARVEQLLAARAAGTPRMTGRWM